MELSPDLKEQLEDVKAAGGRPVDEHWAAVVAFEVALKGSRRTPPRSRMQRKRRSVSALSSEKSSRRRVTHVSDSEGEESEVIY